MDNDLLAQLSSALHQVWLEEQQAAGYHLPSRCPEYKHEQDDDDEMADMVHCKRCNSLLVPFSELDSYSKSQLNKKATRLLDALNKLGLKIS